MRVRRSANDLSVSVFARLRRLFRGGAGTAEQDALIFYVRCDRCGEVIRVRADRRWDLLQEMGEGDAAYSLHKDILGTRCNALIRMVVRFDHAYRVRQQDIEGGRFVSEADYETRPSRDPGTAGRS